MMYEKSFVNLLSSQAVYFKKLSNMLGIVVNLSDDLTNVSVDGDFSSLDADTSFLQKYLLKSSILSILN